jgi:hypothetical protein
LRVLPQGVLHALSDALIHRDSTGFARAWAISSGLAATVAGYLVAKFGMWTAKPVENIALKSPAYAGSQAVQLHTNQEQDYATLLEQGSEVQESEHVVSLG